MLHKQGSKLIIERLIQVKRLSTLSKSIMLSIGVQVGRAPVATAVSSHHEHTYTAFSALHLLTRVSACVCAGKFVPDSFASRMRPAPKPHTAAC